MNSVERISCEVHAPSPKPHLKAAAIFGGAREVIIEHGSEEYRLQITKQGKLILTK